MQQMQQQALSIESTTDSANSDHHMYRHNSNTQDYQQQQQQQQTHHHRSVTNSGSPTNTTPNSTTTSPSTHASSNINDLYDTYNYIPSLFPTRAPSHPPPRAIATPDLYAGLQSKRCAGLMIISRDGYILLLQRSSSNHNRTYDLPGGQIDDEDPEARSKEDAMELYALQQERMDELLDHLNDIRIYQSSILLPPVSSPSSETMVDGDLTNTSLDGDDNHSNAQTYPSSPCYYHYQHNDQDRHQKKRGQEPEKETNTDEDKDEDEDPINYQPCIQSHFPLTDRKKVLNQINRLQFPLYDWTINDSTSPTPPQAQGQPGDHSQQSYYGHYAIMDHLVTSHAYQHPLSMTLTGAMREAHEEIGRLPSSLQILAAVNVYRGKRTRYTYTKRYTIYMCLIESIERLQYRPTISQEHSGYAWVPLPLLPFLAWQKKGGILPQLVLHPWLETFLYQYPTIVKAITSPVYFTKTQRMMTSGRLTALVSRQFMLSTLLQHRYSVILKYMSVVPPLVIQDFDYPERSEVIDNVYDVQHHKCASSTYIHPNFAPMLQDLHILFHPPQHPVSPYDQFTSYYLPLLLKSSPFTDQHMSMVMQCLTQPS